MKFCSKPFEFIHLDPNGGCRLCAWTDINIGNLVDEALEDVWNSENANKLREAIKHGNYEYCRKTSCPFLENDDLPDVDEELAAAYNASRLPTQYSVACDFTCNHKCPSCRTDFFVPDEEYKRKLNIIIDKILPFLNAKETESILTDGNGDCFSSPFLMSMLEKLKPENKDCRIVFETNGVLLDENHWERIKHLSDYYLGVTITPNSFEKTTFEYLNGGVHSYEKMMNSLVFVKNLREQDLINWVRISIVIQERNFHEFPAFAKRCLDEFGADEVVAKPLYRWFMLSQEDYWFKDVLNPLHPYHKEFLTMLDDPIMDDPRIFKWGARNLHEAKRHPAYIYKEYVEIIDKLLNDELMVESVLQRLKAEGASSVYLYGDCELSTVFAKVFKEAGSPVKGIIARDICNKSRGGISIQRLCDYKPNIKDAFIVMNYDFIREITRDLHFMGFSGKIYSARELV